MMITVPLSLSVFLRPVFPVFVMIYFTFSNRRQIITSFLSVRLVFSFLFEASTTELTVLWVGVKVLTISAFRSLFIVLRPPGGLEFRTAIGSQIIACTPRGFSCKGIVRRIQNVWKILLKASRTVKFSRSLSKKITALSTTGPGLGRLLQKRRNGRRLRKSGGGRGRRWWAWHVALRRRRGFLFGFEAIFTHSKICSEPEPVAVVIA